MIVWNAQTGQFKFQMGGSCPQWTFFMAQMVKNLLEMWETRMQFLGQEDPLERSMATHSSIFAWRIPWTEEPGRLQSRGVAKSYTWLSNEHLHLQGLSKSGFELSVDIRALISKSLLLLLPWSLSPATPTAFLSVPILGPPRDETSLSHLNLCRPNSRFLSPGLTRKTQVRKAGAKVLWRLWAKWLSQEFNQHSLLSPGSCKMQTALVNERVISQAGDRSL